MNTSLKLLLCTAFLISTNFSYTHATDDPGKKSSDESQLMEMIPFDQLSHDDRDFRWGLRDNDKKFQKLEPNLDEKKIHFENYSLNEKPIYILKHRVDGFSFKIPESGAENRNLVFAIALPDKVQIIDPDCSCIKGPKAFIASDFETKSEFWKGLSINVDVTKIYSGLSKYFETQEKKLEDKKITQSDILNDRKKIAKSFGLTGTRIIAFGINSKNLIPGQKYILFVTLSGSAQLNDGKEVQYNYPSPIETSVSLNLIKQSFFSNQNNDSPQEKHTRPLFEVVQLGIASALKQARAKKNSSN